MEDAQLRLSQFLTDEIVEKMNKLCLYCRTTNTIAGVLSLTEQEGLNNLATINAIEKKLGDAYEPTMSALTELKASLQAARKSYQERQNQVCPAEIVPEMIAKTDKPLHTPPTPTQTNTKMRKAIEIPAPDRDPELPSLSANTKPVKAVPLWQADSEMRQRSASCSKVRPKNPSSASIDAMLRFMSDHTPMISIPRCDNKVGVDVTGNQPSPWQDETSSQPTTKSVPEIVITRWDKAGNPIMENQPPIYSTAGSASKPDSALMRPPQPLIWNQDFGTYKSPVTRGHTPQVFDLRQKLSKPPGLGRGRALTVGSSWNDSANQASERDRWALRTRTDTMVPVDSDMTTAYPATYLSAFGGIPLLYSVNLKRADTEWPVHVFVKIPGFEWRGAYIDRHASSSVIGEETIPQGAHRNSTLSRLHVDLPWRGKGIPFYIDQAVTVPLTFDNTDLQIEQSFGVVRALKNAIILGQDFVLKHGVYYEVAENENIKVHIRHTWTRGRRAMRAWQIPDGRGSFQPRQHLTHDGHPGSL